MADLRVIDLLGENTVVDMMARTPSDDGLSLDERKEKARETIRGWRRRGRVSGTWYLPIWAKCVKKNIAVGPGDFSPEYRISA